MLKKAILQKNRGFTLPELLVTMTILVLMVMVSVPVFRGWEEKNNTRNGAEILASAMNEARTQSQSPNESAGNRPPKGYGLYITKSDTIKLFKTSSIGVTAYRNETETPTEKEFILQNDTEVSNISGGVSFASIFFATPNAEKITSSALENDNKTVRVSVAPAKDPVPAKSLVVSLDTITGRIKIENP